MNIIFNNDIERIYLSSEYLFLKENEAEDIHFNSFEEFWINFNKNSYIVGGDIGDDTFRR